MIINGERKKMEQILRLKMKDKEFKKNKEDIVCPYENLTLYKEQRVCRYFEQAGDDNKNEFECANCLIGRTSSMLCELKMTKKQVEYWN
jgi:hypothetical protein